MTIFGNFFEKICQVFGKFFDIRMAIFRRVRTGNFLEKNFFLSIFLKKKSSFWQFLTFKWTFSGGSVNLCMRTPTGSAPPGSRNCWRRVWQTREFWSLWRQSGRRGPRAAPPLVGTSTCPGPRTRDLGSPGGRESRPKSDLGMRQIWVCDRLGVCDRFG